MGGSQIETSHCQLQSLNEWIEKGMRQQLLMDYSSVVPGCSYYLAVWKEDTVQQALKLRVNWCSLTHNAIKNKRHEIFGDVVLPLLIWLIVTDSNCTRNYPN